MRVPDLPGLPKHDGDILVFEMSDNVERHILDPGLILALDSAQVLDAIVTVSPHIYTSCEKKETGTSLGWSHTYSCICSPLRYQKRRYLPCWPAFQWGQNMS